MLKNKEKIKEIRKKSDQFVVVCGPSGSGKTMVIKHLVDNYGFLEPSFFTTRELRKGEEEIGGTYLNHNEFMEKAMDGEVFLGARNYGNAYGYDLDKIFKNIMDGDRVVVEAPSSILITDVSYFLPQSTILGIIPLTSEEVGVQLKERALNNKKDLTIRLLNSEIEKEYIVYCCGLIDIIPILPTHGMPKNTLVQVDRLMDKKGFKQVK